MTRARSAGVAALAVWLAFAALACHGNLDFGAGGGVGGAGGAAGSGGAGGVAAPVTCGSDTDCRLSVLHCDVSGSRTCVGCTDDAHCAGTALPRCDLTIHRCVTCLAATDCAGGEICGGGHCVTTCKEDTTPSTCVSPLSCQNDICASCGDEAVCAAGSSAPFCLVTAGICVACRTDADCSGASPRCDPVKRACVACASAADCPATAPLCDPRSGTCTGG